MERYSTKTPLDVSIPERVWGGLELVRGQR